MQALLIIRTLVLTGTLLAVPQSPRAQCSADAGPDQILTCNMPQAILQGSANVPGAVFAWAGPAGFSSALPNPVVDTPGVYCLTITDPAGGCTATDCVVVGADQTAPPVYEIFFPALDCTMPDILLPTCPGWPNSPYECSWASSVGIIMTNIYPYQFYASSPGIYTLTVVNTINGCTAARDFEIVADTSSPQVTAIGDTLGCNGLPGVLSGGPASPGVVFFWEGPGDFTAFQSEITVHIPGTYTLTATSMNGCTVSVTATLVAANNLHTCARISGRITADPNENCQADTSEPGLGFWTMRANSPGGDFYGRSDSAGYYTLYLPPGAYTVQTLPPQNGQTVCQGSKPVALAQTGDTATIDFQVMGVDLDCPILTVDLGTDRLRRCFSNNRYYLKFSNLGLAPAPDAWLLLHLDPMLELVDAQAPFVAIPIGNQVYRFDLGTVAPFQSGQFWVQVQVNCAAAPGQIHCSEAHIFPDSLCAPPAFSGPGEEPDLGTPDTPPLTFKTDDLVNLFPVDNGDAWLDRDCTPNSGAYDPNDKQGIPTVYGPPGYIWPGTELEYLIRFQNTGTDTAFRVVILDTLSGWLDPASVQPGASSHAYRFELSGPGILSFDFQHILLPDSNVNEPASHGFVRFRVVPKATTPLETDIRNRAAIYFDYNEPVITNTTAHRLGERFTGNTSRPTPGRITVSVFPNPMDMYAQIRLNGAPAAGDYRLNLYDIAGKPVRQIQGQTPDFLVWKNELPAGMYFFRVDCNGVPVGSGRLDVTE